MLKEKIVKELLSLGAHRWIKGDMDRLYFTDETLGFKYECYRSSGRISSSEVVRWADLEGVDMTLVNEFAEEDLSNSKASGLAGGKHYIDVKTGEISSFGFFEERIKYLIKVAEEKAADIEEPEELTEEDLKEMALSMVGKEKIGDAQRFLTSSFFKTFVRRLCYKEELALVEVVVSEPFRERKNLELWSVAINLRRRQVAFDYTKGEYLTESGEVRKDTYRLYAGTFANSLDQIVWDRVVDYTEKGILSEKELTEQAQQSLKNLSETYKILLEKSTSFKGLEIRGNQAFFKGMDAQNPAHKLLSEYLIDFATKKVVKAKATLQPENEKFAFRTWLVRMGWKGADTKKERISLYAGLSGNSAFCTETARENWQKKHTKG